MYHLATKLRKMSWWQFGKWNAAGICDINKVSVTLALP